MTENMRYLGRASVQAWLTARTGENETPLTRPLTREYAAVSESCFFAG